MGKPSAPKPSDPVQTASAQTGMNINTAIANQVMGMTNQNGPNGSLSYKQTGTQKITDPNTGKTYEVPRYTSTTKLDPRLAEANRINQRSQVNLAQTGNKVSNQLEKHFDDKFSLSGMTRHGSMGNVSRGTQGQVGAGPNLQEDVAQGRITNSYSTDFSEDRQRVEDALMQRMNPSLQQDRESLEARLASQGIAIGSKAYQDAMGDYAQQSNDARLGAILGAGQEQSRLVGMERDRASFQNSAQAQQFGQDFQQAGFLNAARQGEYDNSTRRVQMNNQANSQQMQNDLSRERYAEERRQAEIQERLLMRNQPLNEIAALMSGSQVSMPQFGSTPQGSVANTDYAGLVANRDAQNANTYGQKMNQWNSTMGGLMGMGSAMILSDRKAKTDIKKVGKTDDGQQIYSYRYKSGGPIQMGLMAQDVEKKKPGAVKTVGGIKMVDYGKALK